MRLTRAQIREAIDRMTPAELAAYAAQMEAEVQARRDHPLAYATFWHRSPPRTSQRRNAQVSMASGRLLRFELGGNRSGKSEGGAIRDVMYALGSDHPDVVAFAEANGLDLEATDLRPGGVDVWHVALTFGDSRRYARPKVAAYLPAGCEWRARDSDNEAEVRLPNGRRIVFKACRQGREGFQGDSVGRVHFDEEPLGASGLAVIRESMMRVADQAGHLELTMTPLAGWTPLLREQVEDPASSGAHVAWLHGPDNPHVPADVLEEILRGYGTHERAARERGEIVALEGRIYTEWRRDLHVVPAFEPPEDWPRYAWVDFGVRNPTAVGFVAVDPRDDTIHLYREHYQAQQTTEWHAHRFRHLSGWTDHDGADSEGGARYRWIVADSAALAERRTWLEQGIVTVPALKEAGSVRAGISLCQARLAPDAEGRPGFVVHDSCPEFVREIESYVWDTSNPRGDLPDSPLKRDDHHMDGWRYFTTRYARLGG